jgi:hypothetical protein
MENNDLIQPPISGHSRARRHIIVIPTRVISGGFLFDKKIFAIPFAVRHRRSRRLIGNNNYNGRRDPTTWCNNNNNIVQ